MKSQAIIYLLLLPLFMLLSSAPPIFAQSYGLYYLIHSCGKNFTERSSAEQGLNNLLQNLTHTLSLNATADYADASNDSLYAVIQCRRDVPAAGDCGRCLIKAWTELRLKCPLQIDAMVWFDGCFLGYSNQNFSRLNTTLYNDFWNPTTTNNLAFVEKRKELMPALACEAESSGRGFSMGSISYNSTHKIYGLVQCNQDLSMDDCSLCLNVSITRILEPCKLRSEPNCETKIGRRILMTNCYIQYELNEFYSNSSKGLIQLPSNGKCSTFLSPTPAPTESITPPLSPTLTNPPTPSLSPTLSPSLPLSICLSLYVFTYLHLFKHS